MTSITNPAVTTREIPADEFGPAWTAYQASDKVNAALDLIHELGQGVYDVSGPCQTPQAELDFNSIRFECGGNVFLNAADELAKLRECIHAAEKRLRAAASER